MLPSANFILSKLPIFEGKKTLVTKNQSIADIKAGIIQTFEADKKDYASIAPYFVGATVKDTCKNVYDFLRKNVKNVTEGENEQLLKHPSAIVATGSTTGSDCKNYSLFTAGILDAINRSGLQKIPLSFRFAKYKNWQGEFLHHVFVVVYPNTKKEIWIDAIDDAGGFNTRSKIPDFFTDKKIQSMALIRMSGTMQVNAMSKAQIVNGLKAERAKRLANGTLKLGSPADMKYQRALQSMGNSDDEDNGGLLAFLPIGKSILDSIVNFLPSKGGLYKDWSRDADGGLAEVVRWTRNDGDNLRQEAADILRLIQERGWETYLNQNTRYGDKGLQFMEVIDKLKRAGLNREATQLEQGMQTATMQTNTAIPKPRGQQPPMQQQSPRGQQNQQPKDNTLLITGGVVAALLLFNK